MLLHVQDRTIHTRNSSIIAHCTCTDTQWLSYTKYALEIWARDLRQTQLVLWAQESRVLWAQESRVLWAQESRVLWAQESRLSKNVQSNI